MPTVLRAGGFLVVFFLPPHEHGPPHVHGRNASGEVVIELEVGGTPQTIRTIAEMRPSDVANAFWLVEAHTEYLLERWKEYHG